MVLHIGLLVNSMANNELLSSKVHRSLTTEMKWGGLPRNIFLSFCAITCFLILVAVLLKIRIGFIVLISGLMYLWGKWMTDQDPQYFKIIFHAIKNNRGVYKSE